MELLVFSSYLILFSSYISKFSLIYFDETSLIMNLIRYTTISFNLILVIEHIIHNICFLSWITRMYHEAFSISRILSHKVSFSKRERWCIASFKLRFPSIRTSQATIMRIIRWYEINDQVNIHYTRWCFVQTNWVVQVGRKRKLLKRKFNTCDDRTEWILIQQRGSTLLSSYVLW